MLSKFISWSSAALLAGTSLLSTPVQAQENCVAGECTVEFSYEGTAVYWSIPQGTQSLRFEVFGASGGRGGLGGQVSGTFKQIPEALYIVVGGAGAVGSQAGGGYNGGGNAGGSRGNEGSGGGASDLRLHSSLESRIVVAGGGGGSGGYSGAAGAPGGQLIADAGSAGQGGGGGGGTNSSGGEPGVSNGGSSATSGSFGLGGIGGTSWNAGGGGGGGGWYGGGGGGADDNTCCADGGGGGGGSSYTDENFVQDETHLKGTWSGNGKIVLHYTVALEVLSTTSNQLLGAQVEFDFVFSMPPIGLEVEDLSYSPSSCLVSHLGLTDLSAHIVLENCSAGEVRLELAANSVGGEVVGPSSPVMVSVSLDTDGPIASWSRSNFTTSQSDLVLQVALGDNLRPISSADFAFSGCEGLVYSSGEVALSGCKEGQVFVELLPGSLLDEWGNTSPESALEMDFWVDQTGPIVVSHEIGIQGDGPFTYNLTITYSESVLSYSNAIDFSASSDCEVFSDLSEVGGTFYAYCGHSEGGWSLNAFSLIDEFGNIGPEETQVFQFSNLEPIVEIAENDSLYGEAVGDSSVSAEEIWHDSSPVITEAPSEDQFVAEVVSGLDILESPAISGSETQTSSSDQDQPGSVADFSTSGEPPLPQSSSAIAMSDESASGLVESEGVLSSESSQPISLDQTQIQTESPSVNGVYDEDMISGSAEAVEFCDVEQSTTESAPSLELNPECSEVFPSSSSGAQPLTEVEEAVSTQDEYEAELETQSNNHPILILLDAAQKSSENQGFSLEGSSLDGEVFDSVQDLNEPQNGAQQLVPSQLAENSKALESLPMKSISYKEVTLEPAADAKLPWLPIIAVVAVGMLGFGIWRFNGR